MPRLRGSNTVAVIILHERPEPSFTVGLVVISMRGVLKVSCVRQRSRENNTSMARSEISETSSTMAIVYSAEPLEVGVRRISAISFIMMIESFRRERPVECC